jgi:hypothetical protein
MMDRDEERRLKEQLELGARRGQSRNVKPGAKTAVQPRRPLELDPEYRTRNPDEIAERAERLARIAREERQRAKAKEAERQKRVRDVLGRNPEAAELPPIERLLRAGDHARLGLGDGGARRCHVEDSPLDRLAARKVLAKDPAANRILHEAGKRYYEHWYLSGMAPLRAIDLSREGIGGAGGSCGMPATEAMAHHRAKYRGAVRVLGPWFSAVVDPIVLAEEDPQIVGMRVSGYRSDKQALAVAIDRLRGGLEALAVHFGLRRLDNRCTGSRSCDPRIGERPEGTPSRALRTHRSLAGM